MDINDLKNYIATIKSIDPSEPLMNIIENYAFKNGLEYEEVGDAIYDDIQLKLDIDKEVNGYATVEEW